MSTATHEPVTRTAPNPAETLVPAPPPALASPDLGSMLDREEESERIDREQRVAMEALGRIAAFD